MESDYTRILALASRGWMSPSQFAGLIGVTYPTMLEMIHKGQVRAVPIGMHYRIYQDEIERFMLDGNATDEIEAITSPESVEPSK